jgi:hypothetical protein
MKLVEYNTMEKFQWTPVWLTIPITTTPRYILIINEVIKVVKRK